MLACHRALFFFLFSLLSLYRIAFPYIEAYRHQVDLQIYIRIHSAAQSVISLVLLDDAESAFAHSATRIHELLSNAGAQIVTHFLLHFLKLGGDPDLPVSLCLGASGFHRTAAAVAVFHGDYQSVNRLFHRKSD